MNDGEPPTFIGEYRLFQLLVEKRHGGWRGYAIRNIQQDDSQSAERVAFVVEEVSQVEVEVELRSRVDAWSDRPAL